MARHGRREVAQDTLAGQALITPARLAGPGLQAPNQPRPQPSVSAAIADELGQWATERLQQLTNAQNERSMMDGAIAATQGKALDALVTEGADKWALEGHRVITAQSISSQLQAAQIQLIEDSAFALGPDAYRAQLTEQLSSLTDGQDAVTARMINERTTAMLPELVGRQTAAHANFQEDQTFDAVVQSMSAMSEDSVGREGLLSMALGDGTASGLSQSRFDYAITEGIVLGFVNGNPRAYHLMKSNGILDDFSTDQLNRIHDAEKQWQTRLRTEVNTTRLNQHMALDKLVNSGADHGLTPQEVAEQHSAIDAQWQIERTYQDEKADYAAARDPINTAAMTRFKIAEASKLRGDHPAWSKATVGIILSNESRPDAAVDIQGPLVLKGANAGFRAQSPMQVMPPTLADPGFGVRPSDGSDTDNYRTGVDYWAAMGMGSDHPSGVLKYPPMDIEAAAIAYNAGFTNANKWFEAGRDYSVLPDRAQTEPYAKEALKKYNDQEAMTVGTKHNVALAQLQEAKRRAGIEIYNLVMPHLKAQDALLLSGDIDIPTWMQNRGAIITEAGLNMTKAMGDDEIRTVQEKFRLAEAQAKLDQKATNKILTDEAMLAITLELATVQTAVDAVMRDPSVTQEQMQEAVEIYTVLSSKVFEKHGIRFSDKRNRSLIESNIKQWQGAIAAHEKRTADNVLIDFAVNTNTVRDLPDRLQRLYHERRRKETAVENAAAFDMSDQGPEAVLGAIERTEASLHDSWKQSGSVDPQSVDTESNTLSNTAIIETVDGQGKTVKTVNPDAVDSILRYRRFVQTAPTMGEDFYDAEATVLAKMALDIAGVESDPELYRGKLKDALWSILQEEKLTKARLDALDVFSAADETEKASLASVKNFIDKFANVNLLQAAFRDDSNLRSLLITSTETEGRNSEITKQHIEAGLLRELRALKIARRYANTDLLVKQAMERLQLRSTFIGRDFIMTQKNLPQEIFGGRANQYSDVGDVERALRFWHTNPAVQKTNPEFDDTSWIEAMPRWLQWAGSAFVHQVGFGYEWPIDQALSLKNYIKSEWRNVRPIAASLNVDGNIVTRAMNNLGNFEGPGLIIDDLGAVGDYFMKHHPTTPSEDPNAVVSAKVKERAKSALSLLISRGVSFE